MEVPTFSGRITDKEENPFALRKEDDPSFSVYINRKKGSWYWKDQGTGKFGSHWDFIMEKTGLNYTESIDYAKQKILGLGDYGVDNDRINLAALRLAEQTREVRIQVKTVITPVFRPWNSSDEAYFQTRNEMSCDELRVSCYFPVSKAEIITEIKRYIIYERTISPIYAIWFPTRNYKIYRPIEAA